MTDDMGCFNEIYRQELLVYGEALMLFLELPRTKKNYPRFGGNRFYLMGAGADTMIGGAGNATYTVDNTVM